MASAKKKTTKVAKKAKPDKKVSKKAPSKASAVKSKASSQSKSASTKKPIAKKPDTPSKQASSKPVAASKSKKVESPKKIAPVKSKALEPIQENFDGADEQWVSLYKSHKSEKPVAYNMSENFDIKTVIHHKVLGWGYVIKSKENRIDVVFRDGVKTLITNYKA